MNRLALVSGATGGLGKAMALECAARGYDIFITDLSETRLASLAEGIRRQYGTNVHFKACELTEAESVKALWEDAEKKGPLFLLVNVAGLDYEGEFMDVEAEKLNHIVRVNIESMISMTSNAVSRHEAGREMHIINVCSLAAYYPMPVKAVYAASKRFILNLSLALSEELRRRKITVTALCPAGMPTTEECIESIRSQGLAGALTTCDSGAVAHQCVSRALAGKKVYVPGILNAALKGASALLPPSLLARFIYRRWRMTREKLQQVPIAPDQGPASASFAG
jgi:uncharacterized protein